MNIPIASIHESSDLRRVGVASVRDALLTSSIRSMGVLQPILVRPDSDGYLIITGRRRVRCAMAAGLTEIPAEITTMTDAWALAAQAAENIVREPMHAIDQWRAVRDIVAAGGLEMRDAASALGLDERETRKMERLGMLDPKLLALIEDTGDMPRDFELRVIANAPAEMQAKAARNQKAVEEWNGSRTIRWHVIAQACQIVRYSRAHALFDVGAMTWDVDLFAQPGAEDEYTTTDGETFLRLQMAALEAQVQADRAVKKRVQLVEFDKTSLRPELPAGFAIEYSGKFEKLKRHETLFVALDPSGKVSKIVGVDLKAVKAAEAKKAERGQAAHAEAPDTNEDHDDPSEPDDDEPVAPAVPAEKPGLTKAGLAMVAAAKTQALRETLRTGLAEVAPERLLALMLLAWGAGNVSVHGLESRDGGYNPDWNDFRDVAAQLLLPGGSLGDVSMADVRTLVGEVMARVLSFAPPNPSYGNPGSGVAAEWIGAAIGADGVLPRFDTAEFLAQAGGDELRRALTAAGEKTTGTVKVLRERMQGRMADWRPAAAAFGAPAPVLYQRKDF